jgi:hypothetical protein
MNDSAVVITLDGDRRVYQPGDTLSAEYHMDSLSLSEPKALEVSVLWYTEGKGDEDLAVHYFERVSSDETTSADFRRPARFSTTLPNSPMSYEGVILKIRWCVRVRMFLARGKELLAEVPFRLGNIPDAVVVTP